MRQFRFPKHRSPQLGGIACFIVVMLSPWAPLLAQAPIVRGYVLGTPASEFNINRVPCEPWEGSLHCRVTDNLTLVLHRDTLVSVRVKLGSQAGVEGEVKARQQWDHVQDSLVALYGEPDSVRITNLSESASDALQMKRLEASWGPFTPTEPWGLLYTVIETTYDGITVTQPQLVSAQCSWPDQAPMCAEILKEPRP